MSMLLQPLFILACFVLVRAGDLSISAALDLSKFPVRRLCYGFVAMFALMYIIIALFGLH